MQYLYRYTPHNTEHKYDIITNSQLWFSRVENFNDPIDSKLDYRQVYTPDEIKIFWQTYLKNNPTDPQSLEEILQNRGSNTSFVDQQNRVFELFRKEIGVLCFSLNPKNILMWSHYANNHKGIVYEFKADLFLKNRTNSFKAKPYKVDYPCDRNYDLLSYSLTDIEKNKQFVKELTTKAKDWAYEEEYRMIDLKNSGNKTFNKESLTSIIFGVNTSKIEISIIQCLCKQYGFNHVNFKKANFVQGKFEIKLLPI